MNLLLRVTNLSATPSDTSGFLISCEVADVEELRAQLLRQPDDDADDWPLAKRYSEIVDEAQRLRTELAAAEKRGDTFQDRLLLRDALDCAPDETTLGAAKSLQAKLAAAEKERDDAKRHIEVLKTSYWARDVQIVRDDRRTPRANKTTTSG